MPVVQKPILHGRDHGCGGADPIPGICDLMGGSFSDWALALPGIWAYWPLQEASGDAIDQGPTNADCQPVGTPAYRVTGPNESDLPFAVRLTGSPQSTISNDSFYNSADQLGLGSQSSASAFTAVCWIKPDSGATSSWPLPVIGTWDNFRSGWILYLMESTRQLNFSSGDTTDTDFLIGPVIPMDEWSLVAVTRSSSADVTLYVDGAEVASDSGLGNFAGNGHGIRLGAVDFATSDPDSYHFYGDMAGAVFVDSALSGGEILQAYNAGTGAPNSGPPGPTGPTGATGATGPGVPTGGSSGQVLTKTSGSDYATAWQTPSGGDPASDTSVWMPLLDSDGSIVFDDTDQIIPVLIPL